MQSLCGLWRHCRVPEQAAALEALAAIGGPEAARSVAQMIVKEIVQGPTLAVAVSAASQLGVKFPHLFALRLLRHSDPAVRAPACDCVRAGPEIVAALSDLLDDGDRENLDRRRLRSRANGESGGARSVETLLEPMSFAARDRGHGWGRRRRNRRFPRSHRTRAPRTRWRNSRRARRDRSREGGRRRVRPQSLASSASICHAG